MRSEHHGVATAVPRLRDRPIREGERWIYSAGFNVDRSLSSTARIDTELGDIGRIMDSGGRVAILSHQGSHRDGTAVDLDFVAEYLSDRLDRTVAYVPENDTSAAEARARALRPGTAAVFGNTREHHGEQRNDPTLARRFAALGDFVAVGGFSKAHRAHASNVGILQHRPGYLADSVLTELELLAPWAGRADRYSVAVLGGVKPEKTVIGLDAMTGTYDVVIPGGAVLNSVLRALGHDIGSSELGESPDRCLRLATTVLGRHDRAEVHIPSEVVMARIGENGFHDARTVAISDGIPSGWAIVDFVPMPWMRERLGTLAARGGRALVAGTPCRFSDGFRTSATAVLDAFGAPAVQALLLGGDTVAELPWQGPVSTGGGSALHYLAHGTVPVLDALTPTNRELAL
ncbi:phosphoglycerate kinase [Saccharopolyspora phatthalungensis]|uniref:Phosphoglycerate kinase n=1 Tax=Saccharopolyspora phatthalungensis TaxID=664693 RepID=A0A840QKU9_9PSEU|nr:phosphoglycerate kinase [Saccharopolyspora phatthalungensis]MBB5159503.1 phosphoglycerate kinase [Saccharopolyspora phatthalungensis]